MSHLRKHAVSQSEETSNTARIFIVEDEIVIVRGLEETVERLGYSMCGFAFSGEEAIELIERQKPDLVLVDIHLKGEMDGIELAERIILNHGIPVVYITAYSDRDVLERAKITDPSGYIVKPVRNNQLKVNIELALERCSRDRAKTDILEAYRSSIQELQHRLDDKTDRLEETNNAMEWAIAELARKKAKVEDLRQELQEVNNSLLNLTAHTARMRKDLDMEVIVALRKRIMPILRELQSDPSFERFHVEFEMLAMQMSQLSGDLMEDAHASSVLSTTELRIAALIGDGLTSHEIANRLCLSLETVKTHRRNIRKKLGITNTRANLSRHLKSRWGIDSNNQS
ncbi:MAG: response regulator [Syntrophobacteraceae bacterium]